MAHVDKLQKQLNAGTVSLVVLTLLDRIREPMYGYQISKILESLTDGRPTDETGDSLPGAAFVGKRRSPRERRRAFEHRAVTALLPHH